MKEAVGVPKRVRDKLVHTIVNPKEVTQNLLRVTKVFRCSVVDPLNPIKVVL